MSAPEIQCVRKLRFNLGKPLCPVWRTYTYGKDPMINVPARMLRAQTPKASSTIPVTPKRRADLSRRWECDAPAKPGLLMNFCIRQGRPSSERMCPRIVFSRASRRLTGPCTGFRDHIEHSFELLLRWFRANDTPPTPPLRPQQNQKTNNTTFGSYRGPPISTTV
jgi:hypothetical protein